MKKKSSVPAVWELYSHSVTWRRRLRFLILPILSILPRSDGDEVGLLGGTAAPRRIEYQQLGFDVRVGPGAVRSDACQHRFRDRLSLKLSVDENLFSIPILPVFFLEVLQQPGVCFLLWFTEINEEMEAHDIRSRESCMFTEKRAIHRRRRGWAITKKNSFGTLQNSIQALLLVAIASVQPANRVAHTDPAPSKLEDMAFWSSHFKHHHYRVQ